MPALLGGGVGPHALNRAHTPSGSCNTLLRRVLRGFFKQQALQRRVPRRRSFQQGQASQKGS